MIYRGFYPPNIKIEHGSLFLDHYFIELKYYYKYLKYYFYKNRAEEFASLMTPVPGGIGPLTISHLCRNTLNSNLLRNGFPILSLLETYPDDHI